MTLLQPGTQAPLFSLPDQDGMQRSLADVRGRWLLLYAYPKDATPGCTDEACGLRDGIGGYRARGCEVWGISADGRESHKKFADKHALPFPLLSDTEKTTLTAYGAYGEKYFMGKIGLGVKRVSYLIDPDGRIAKVYPKVSPTEHAEEVLADLDALQA